MEWPTSIVPSRHVLSHVWRCSPGELLGDSQTPLRPESPLRFVCPTFAADDVWTAGISAPPLDARRASAPEV